MVQIIVTKRKVEAWQYLAWHIAYCAFCQELSSILGGIIDFDDSTNAISSFHDNAE